MHSSRWEHYLYQQRCAWLQTDEAERTVDRALAGRYADLSPPWPQLRAMIFLRTKTAIRPVWPAAGRPSRSGPKIGMPASPRRDPSKLKSAPCMENGSTSTRKPVAGSLPGQTHRMAETCRGEINAGQAIRLKTGLAMAHCPAFSGVDLYRSAVRNSPYS